MKLQPTIRYVATYPCPELALFGVLCKSSQDPAAAKSSQKSCAGLPAKTGPLASGLARRQTGLLGRIVIP